MEVWTTFPLGHRPADGSHFFRIETAALTFGSSRRPAVSPNGLTEQQEGVVPRWAPDGKNVYFRAPAWQNEIWAVTFEDRRERLVADLSPKLGSMGAATLATDGEYLYFTWEEMLGDIWVMDVVWDE